MSARRWRRLLSAGVLVLAAGTWTCRSGGVGSPPEAPRPDSVRMAFDGLDADGRAWAEATLGRLDLAGRVGQMVMVRAYGRPDHPATPERRALAAEVSELGVGGVVLFRSEVDSIPRLIAELEDSARVPLLVASDLERSLSFRVVSGSTPLPDAMALGATRSVAAARLAGELTAREGRAAGIHWAFAPVADVNSDPANPIINLRSFGERPELVAEMVAAFVEGARAGGILTSAKHFPGHGETALDSHLELPTIPGDRARLDRVELAPFRAAIAAGVDSVMVGHLAVPALDPSGRPATLSRPISTGLLRGELGFDGLVVTDAMEMRGVGGVWMGEAVVEAVAAGADVVLLPADPRVAVRSLLRAVEEGLLTPERIEASVARILAAKARLGLHRSRAEREQELRARRSDIGRPDDLRRADEIARAAITLVRDDRRTLPLRIEDPLRILHLVASSDWVNAAIVGLPEAELARRGVVAETRRLGPAISEVTAAEIAALAPGFTHVVVSAFVRVTSSKGRADMDATHAALVERLAAGGAPVIVVSYGSPYLLTQFPSVPVYLCAYGAEASSQRAAVAALFGEHPIAGKLPVTIPGVAPFGHGIERPARRLELEPSSPEAAGFRPEGLAEVDRLIAAAVADGAFPGGVVAIGRNGRLAHLRPFGRQTYAPDAPQVEADTIYDLASLTKVVATTTAAMLLVDEGRLDLDARVASLLPRFAGPGKDRVTVRHLLTHSSGIDWWAPLYRELSGRAAFLDRIYSMPLVSEPGAQMKYSDLGILLLGEVLERVAGRPVDELVRERLFEPLGMRDTGWRPEARLATRIAPTEFDPWRGRVVHGEVHDENAFALGGVAPHAGLFGTARDLARFAQMLLWKGAYGGQRIVRRETVELFTRAAGSPEGSSRALGWDTKSPSGSSAGELFSGDSFGHTGFTGTSIWIDPERDLFLVLLTNRVHPTRENRKIAAVRPALADAVIRALSDPDREIEVGGLAAVQVGLDRIAAGDAAPLAGKRLGLVAHAASVTTDGRHAIAVLREQGLDLVRLFSPEHGLRGLAAAGESVPSGIDGESGLPVVSLYAGHPQPTAEDLAGLDALVFDLQDAGVRFYTYASTLLLCLDAAAEADIELIVLDRPNPLGGRRVAGPRRATPQEVPLSLVSRAPGPLVHGLTMGEMARHANARRARPARLTVVPMAGWRREMTWPATGRRWVAPSPNLRSAEAALAYPGIALLEATNVSEGRGTEAPFLRIGAPWLDPAQVAVTVPGFRLVPTRFTPRASPEAPDPKYRDVECEGFRIEVTDPDVADGYRLGIELLRELSRQPRFEWLRGGEALTWLTGTPEVLLEVRRRGGESIAGSSMEGADAWWHETRSALLYGGACRAP